MEMEGEDSEEWIPRRVFALSPLCFEVTRATSDQFNTCVKTGAHIQRETFVEDFSQNLVASTWSEMTKKQLRCRKLHAPSTSVY